MGSEVRILLTSLPSLESAERLAEILVDERLAACAQLLPAVLSIYRWQGQRVRDSECLLLIKTRPELAAQCEQRITALHPYECLELVTLAPDAVNAAYAAWVRDTTHPREAYD